MRYDSTSASAVVAKLWSGSPSNVGIFLGRWRSLIGELTAA